MLPIQMRRRHRRDEELAPVRVRPRIRHAQQKWAVVLADEILVIELVAVDGFPARAVTSSEVPTLEHEFGDDAVEAGALVPETFLTGAEGAEVLGGAGDDVVVEVEDDAGWGTVVDGDVEVALGLRGRRGGGWCWGGGLLGRCRGGLLVLLATKFVDELGHLNGRYTRVVGSFRRLDYDCNHSPVAVVLLVAKSWFSNRLVPSGT